MSKGGEKREKSEDGSPGKLNAAQFESEHRVSLLGYYWLTTPHSLNN